MEDQRNESPLPDQSASVAATAATVHYSLAQELQDAEPTETAINFDPRSLQQSNDDLNFGEPAGTSNRNKKRTTMIRFVTYLFMAFYLYFGILVMLNNSHLKHQDRLMSNIVGMSIAENRMKLIYSLESTMLNLCALVGIYALINKGYRLFLLFAGIVFFTMIITAVAFGLSVRSSNEINDSIDNRQKLIGQIHNAINHYDWFDFTNENTNFINKFQFEFECCGGINGTHDWERTKPHRLPYGAFPVSCCMPPIHLDVQYGRQTIRWCTYAQVESRPDCPSAFIAHLIHIQNIIHGMNILLFESLLMQILAVTVFVSMIIRQFRNM